MRRTSLLAGFAAATLLTGMSFANAGQGNGGTGSHDCGSSYTATWTPTSVWPPNHKYVDGTLTYTAPADGDNLSLAIGAITHDEMTSDGTELNGTGNTPVDSTGSGGSINKDGARSVSLPFQIRAERAGGGNGRTYSIPFMARASRASSNLPILGNPGDENNCSGTATVFVPHDMGGGNN
jgi:hypothetical protein